MSLSISIQLLSGTAMEFNVESLQTVGSLKNMIESFEGISAHQQRLTSGDHILHDNEVIGEYFGKSVVLQTRLQLYVAISAGQTIVVDVWDADLISDVKVQIENQVSIPVGHQRLMFAGEWLGDDRSLSQLSVKRHDTIECHLLIQVSVQDENGDIDTIMVDSSETIGNIMHRLAAYKPEIPRRQQHWMILRLPEAATADQVKRLSAAAISAAG
jgi:hypothetical protein